MKRLMTISALLAAGFAIAACEPVTPDAPGSVVPTGPYVMVGVGQDTVPLRNVGINIKGETIDGQGPCNSFSAKQVGTPPGFAIADLTTGQAACSGTAGALEARFFQRLREANSIKYLGGVLTIMGPTEFMTFEPGYRK